MSESLTYPEVFDSGPTLALIRGAQAALLLLGRRYLGEPDRAAVVALEAITDLDRLDRLSEGLARVTS